MERKLASLRPRNGTCVSEDEGAVMGGIAGYVLRGSGIQQMVGIKSVSGVMDMGSG